MPSQRARAFLRNAGRGAWPARGWPLLASRMGSAPLWSTLGALVLAAIVAEAAAAAAAPAAATGAAPAALAGRPGRAGPGTTAAPPKNSTLIRLTEDPLAVCLDGTPAGYYFRPGFGTGSRKFYIHHEGGGWCQMERPLQNWPNDNCLDRANNSNPTAWLARLGTLTADPPSMPWDLAYSSADAAVNPLMYNWNSVYLRCACMAATQRLPDWPAFRSGVTTLSL